MRAVTSNDGKVSERVEAPLAILPAVSGVNPSSHPDSAEPFSSSSPSPLAAPLVFNSSENRSRIPVPISRRVSASPVASSVKSPTPEFSDSPKAQINSSGTMNVMLTTEEALCNGRHGNNEAEEVNPGVSSLVFSASDGSSITKSKSLTRLRAYIPTSPDSPVPIGEPCWSDILELKSLVPGADSPKLKNIAGPLPANSYLESDHEEQRPETELPPHSGAKEIEGDQTFREGSLIEAVRFPEMRQLIDKTNSFRAGNLQQIPNALLEGRLSVLIYSARNLPETKRLSHSADPFVQLFLLSKYSEETVFHRTGIQWGNLSPSWVEQFVLDVDDLNGALILQVMDAHRSGDADFVGQVMVELSQLKDQKSHSMTLPINFEGAV